MQVWNANTCNAVVGAFNLQGSAWDRKKRQYTTYNSKPPTLTTEIRVKDVPVFSSQPSLVHVVPICLTGPLLQSSAVFHKNGTDLPLGAEPKQKPGQSREDFSPPSAWHGPACLSLSG